MEGELTRNQPDSRTTWAVRQTDETPRCLLSPLLVKRERCAGFGQNPVEGSARPAQTSRHRAAGLIEVNLAVAIIPGRDLREVLVGAARSRGPVEVEGRRAG